MSRGDAFVAKKDYQRALLEYRNAASAKPNDAEPHFRTGLAYLSLKDIPNSARAFRRATSLNPNHADAKLKLAGLMLTSQDHKLLTEAVSTLQDTLGLAPDNIEAIDTLALAEWKLGKLDDASQRLESALKKFPTHLQTSVTLAQMKILKKDWSGAEEVLKKAARDAPDSSTAALALGELYLVLRQPAKAEEELQRAIRLDDKNGQALFRLGTLQAIAARLEEAEATYKRLSSLPEKNYKPLHAMFLFQTGKRAEAVSEFETLAKAEPDDRDARTRLVAAYLATDRSGDAEKVIAAALKKNDKDTDALLQRANLSLRAGKAEEAEKDLKAVLHFVPSSADAHFALARVYAAKNSPGMQKQALEEALRLNPRMLNARLALESLFLAANQGKAALDLMEGAPAPQKSDYLWVIGRNLALLSLGNMEESRKGIDQALQMGRRPEAVFQEGVLLMQQRAFRQVLVRTDELLKSGVLDVRVLQLMMNSYANFGETAKGVERLQQIAAEHPQSAVLQQLAGDWLARTGNSAEAQKAFERAKAVDQNFTRADLALADLDLRAGRGPSAKRRLDSVITRSPKHIPALLLSARAEEAAGDRAAMEARYREVLNIDGSNVTALNNLAYILSETNPDEALGFAQTALQKAPDNAGVQDTLGWIYYQKRMYKMAAQHLKIAVDKEPNPRRQLHLGMAHLRMGDSAGRMIVLDALQKDPSLKTEWVR